MLKILPNNCQLFTEQSFYELHSLTSKQIQLTLLDEQTITAETCLSAIGSCPDTEFLTDFLSLNLDGTIPVNQYLQTLVSNVYACGELIRPSGSSDVLNKHYSSEQLANTGQIVAQNINHAQTKSITSPSATLCIKLFNHYIGSCGITLDEANFNGQAVQTATIHDHTIETDLNLDLEIVYENQSKRLLGLQLISKHAEHLDLINKFSLLLDEQASLKEFLQFDAITNNLAQALHYQ